MKEDFSDNILQVAHFFIDESFLLLESREHMISCAILPEDVNEIIQGVIAFKKSVGLGSLDEIKFNSSGLPQEKKILLTDGVIEVMDSCTGFISIVEGSHKGELAESVVSQIADYCSHKGIPYFSLNFDGDLVPSKKNFENYVRERNNQSTACVGIQHLNSKCDQIIQLCDLFLGLYRLSIQIEFGERIIPRKIYRSDFHGEEEWSLSDIVLLGTRGRIWGATVSELYEDHPEYGEIFHPYHVSYGKGVRLKSTISKEAKSIIKDRLATTYLGCLA